MHSMHVFVTSIDIQGMLDLHIEYGSKKKRLTDQAWVEDSVKSEIEEKLELKYAEIDVVVSRLIRYIYWLIEYKYLYLIGSKTTPSWAN